PRGGGAATNHGRNSHDPRALGSSEPRCDRALPARREQLTRPTYTQENARGMLETPVVRRYPRWLGVWQPHRGSWFVQRPRNKDMTMPAMGVEGLPGIGDLFEGKYKIEKLIGKGGMGAVFAAHHTMLDQRVAVKFLLGDMVTNPEAARRFENEAKAAAQIRGEHICRVFDFG